MQDDQLRVSAARGGKNLSGHLEQRFIMGILIRFKITVFQELHFIGTFGNAGDSGVIFTNLALVGEPPGLKTCPIGQRDEVILILRFAVNDTG